MLALICTEELRLKYATTNATFGASRTSEIKGTMFKNPPKLRGFHIHEHFCCFVILERPNSRIKYEYRKV